MRSVRRCFRLGTAWQTGKNRGLSAASLRFDTSSRAGRRGGGSIEGSWLKTLVRQCASSVSSTDKSYGTKAFPLRVRRSGGADFYRTRAKIHRFCRASAFELRAAQRCCSPRNCCSLRSCAARTITPLECVCAAPSDSCSPRAPRRNPSSGGKSAASMSSGASSRRRSVVFLSSFLWPVWLLPRV